MFPVLDSILIFALYLATALKGDFKKEILKSILTS